jgi:hypothetical protein
MDLSDHGCELNKELINMDNADVFCAGLLVSAKSSC